MKRIITLLLTLTSFSLFSQAPQTINYQGVARSGNGNTFTTNISLRFEILEGATPVFTETQPSVPVSSQGVFSTRIGMTNTLGIAAISWTNSPYSLRVSIDTTGQNDPNKYVTMATQVLSSVPFALYAPAPTLSVTGNTISLGTQTAALPATGGFQTLSVIGNSLAISGTGGNTVVIPSAPLTAAGATTITPNGNGYTINTPSVTVNELIFPPFTPAPNIPGNIVGIAQIIGTSPNFSVVVAPDITYNQNSGNLVITNRNDLTPLGVPLTPAYIYTSYITPNLGFTNGTLTVGPSANSQNLNGYMPWRAPLPSLTTVTLANIAANVGIGVNTPTTQLHIDGFTQMGVDAPRMQVKTFTGTTNGSQGGNVTIGIPSYVLQSGAPVQITPAKILSASVMVQTSGGEWVHPGNIALPGTNFNWHMLNSNNSFVITNILSASGNILNQTVRITITYMP